MKHSPRPVRQRPVRTPPAFTPWLRRIALLAVQGSDLAHHQGRGPDALDAIQAHAGDRWAAGHRAEAVAALAGLVLQRPTEARYQFTLARALQLGGQVAEAAAQFTLGLLFDPHDGWAVLHWGECLAATGHLAQALDAWRACLALCASACDGGRLQQCAQQRLDAAQDHADTASAGAAHHG